MPIVTLNEYVHLELVKEQTKLLEKGIKLRLQDIAEMAIIDSLHSKEQSNKIQKIKVKCVTCGEDFEIEYFLLINKGAEFECPNCIAKHNQEP